MYTSELQETLDGGRGNDTGTTGSWDKLECVRFASGTTALSHKTYTNGDGTTLSALLSRKRVRLTKVGTPVTTTDWHNGELGDDDSCADGGRDFFRGLDPETNVTLRVANDDNGLETGTLTGTSLLLNGLDL